MTRTAYGLILLSTTLLTMQSAWAANNPAGRYTMSPAEDGGFVRLDTQTGAMSLCTSQSEGWSCKPINDAATDMTKKIDELRAENKALKNEIKEMETVFGLDNKKQTGPTPPKFKIPTEEDVDTALNYMEHMFKKFRERIDRLEKNTRPDAETPNTPQSTPL